ncbi:MAG TPA: type VII secretion-associated serine protease mycosin [Streptomyces sp.]|nr:type VII secretion-associated serine protease mycosin [Streptomyces sp.]
MPRPHRAAAYLLAVTATLTTAGAFLTTPAAAAGPAYSDECAFPNGEYPGRPWALQRVMLDRLWSRTKGEGVRVAVIDTGVDVKNPQLKGAVDIKSGRNLLPGKPKDKDGNRVERGNARGTTDTTGHGTKVAGIIAARPAKGTGFVGLAPEATIIPIRQNDEHGNGSVDTLINAIGHAVAVRADVINISQDTSDAKDPGPPLEKAINAALDKDIVVVASAGNDGGNGKGRKTYPASYDGVLAVASSDRNNERAAFSQSGTWVDVAAPGVDMISTVPGGGHCSDSGTSFSAPYVAGVAALLRSEHPTWSARQIVAQIEQTAERATADHDMRVGWGVIDPVRALTEDDHPIESPNPREGMPRAKAPDPAAFPLGETPDERNARLGTYVAVGAAVLVAGLGGVAVTIRDARRRARRSAGDG